jgi:hypothetical protein
LDIQPQPHFTNLNPSISLIGLRNVILNVSLNVVFNAVLNAAVNIVLNVVRNAFYSTFNPVVKTVRKAVYNVVMNDKLNSSRTVVYIRVSNTFLPLPSALPLPHKAENGSIYVLSVSQHVPSTHLQPS